MPIPLRSFIPLAALTVALAGCDGSDAPPATPGNGSIVQSTFAGEPPLETDEATLAAALVCTPFTHPDKPPVLLVHGTFTTGYEQYDWTYLPLLDERGFDVCAVTYPDRGLGDQQISAEYVVHALRTIHAQTGRKVAMIGHSQGAGMPRWALRWWPSAAAATADFVLQAGPNHGTIVAAPGGSGMGLPLIGQPEATWQFQPGSQFITAVNNVDETPGDVAYTSLYSQFDELVQPFGEPFGAPTAALDLGLDNPNVTNLLLQDLCPGKLVDHVTIGTIDALSFALTLDAISNPGPLNIERAGGTALCGLAPIVPELLIHSSAVTAMLAILPKEDMTPTDLHLSTREPPLKPYAQ